MAVVAVAATGAFFSDEETSTGNTFVAGALDLTVDSTCHYWTDVDANGVFEDSHCETDALHGNWNLTDLGDGTHKFFNFTDLKPGDHGEDTVSLHVDNDAWLRLVINNLSNLDNSCTEPEDVAEGNNCGEPGELQENLLFTVWLDDGQIPGFGVNDADSEECDNVQNGNEQTIISEGPIDPIEETWDLADFAGSYLHAGETTCFGIAWSLPSDTGNEVQTDSFTGDMSFLVLQHRNNPTPIWP